MELHCAVGIIRVGENNKTAAAGAAYISCSKIEGHDGRTHNFTHKKNFVTGGVILPDGAPERWREDPRSIWAEQDYLDYVKSTRRGPKAELYRRGDIGLPWALSDEQCIKIAEELFEVLREKGMVVQWGIHDEPADKENGQERNRHLHWMAAMREVTPDGFGKKNRTWNNYNGGLNIPELIRPLAAELLNRELENVGADFRVEHESFEARGVDKVPEIHVGVSGMAIHRKGGESRRYERNEAVKEANKDHRDYFEKMRRYRKERAAASKMTLLEAEGRQKNIEDILRVVENVKGNNKERKKVLEEPLKGAREEAYQGMKACNYQICALKKDKEKCRNMTRALHLIKNLAGEPELKESQQKELEWAVNYLRWAGIKDLSPENVYKTIKELRENNTQSVIEIHKLQKEKEKLYEKLTEVRKAERSLKKLSPRDKWLTHK